MNLHSPQTFWPQHDGTVTTYPVLRSNIQCEIAIIGGGVTGALVADALVQQGYDCVLLDKGEIGGGSTAASTSLLLYEIDIDLHQLIPLVGEAHAVRAYELCRKAIYSVEKICAQLPENCSFEWKPSWYLAQAPEDVPRIHAEYEARCRYGFDVQLLSRAEIEARGSFPNQAALLSSEAAQLDVFRFTHLLMQRCIARGLRVYTHSPVTDYASDEKGVTLNVGGAVAEGGAAVNGVIGSDVQMRARRVVFATGYEAQKIIREPVVRFKSTYVAVSEPLPSFTGWPDRCLIWDTARPYFYARTTEDNRAMIGGEDDELSTEEREAALPAKIAGLKEQFRALFPHLPFETSTAYAATFGETRDGLAYIGEYAGFPHGLFALGFGGNGIVFSVIAARLIADAVGGKPNPDAEIFRFGR